MAVFNQKKRRIGIQKKRKKIVILRKEKHTFTTLSLSVSQNRKVTNLGK